MRSELRRTSGERVFRAILRAYPAEFRMAHESDLLDFFREHRIAVRKRGRVWGVPVFWMRTLFDLIPTAARLRLRTVFRGGGARRSPRSGRGGDGMMTSLGSLFQDLR